MRTVKTTAAAVQIYRSGADVTRKGKAELEQGTNELEIRGLSYNAVIDTVKLFFPAGIGLADIHFRHGADKDDDSRESVTIREKITALQKQQEILEMQANLWRENAVFNKAGVPDVKEVEGYIEKLPERLGKLNEALDALIKEQKKLEKALKEADKAENLPVITVVLEAPHTGTYDFEVHYHEPSASWMPVYEVHTDAEGPLQLKVRSRIYQHTEEDWKDVQVSLLTSIPSGGSLPVLDPLYLSYRAPVVRNAARSSGARAMPMGMMKAAMPMDAMMMEEALEDDGTAMLERIETTAAEAERSETMTEYILPGRKTIPAGTKGTMADLLEHTLPVTYEIVAVPKEDVRAYLAAKVKTTDLPEGIRGTAGIYLNGTYAGETEISADLTKETLDLPLGKEEGIQVSRTEKKRKTSEALIKNQKTTEYEYELKITNGRNKETEITVQDQIPVSRDKTIVVETVKTDGAQADDKGILSWKLKLEPKETKELHVAYKVSWQKDKQLQETYETDGRYCPVCGAKIEGNLRFCPECGSPIN